MSAARVSDRPIPAPGRAPRTSSSFSNGSAALRWLLRAPAEMGEATLALQRIVQEGNRAGDVIEGCASSRRGAAFKGSAFQVNDAIEDTISLVKSELASKQNKPHGATFSFTLPAAAEPAAQ
jgi:hypothetical protein